MARRTWRITLDGEEHEICVEYRPWLSSERIISVDGMPLVREKCIYTDTGTRHLFSIGSHDCEVIVPTRGVISLFVLEIDGVPLPQNILLRPSQAPVASADVLLRPAQGNAVIPSQELLRASEENDKE